MTTHASGVLVVTTPYVAGHRITEMKGEVFGLVVRSRGLGGNRKVFGLERQWQAKMIAPALQLHHPIRAALRRSILQRKTA